jgi:N-acetylglutamate synthase-like GNAT family acetyltransferase
LADLIIKLYDLNLSVNYENLKKQNILIKRASILDKKTILNFVSENFNEGWVNECEYALFNNPISCYIAVKNKEIIGFACYDVAAKGFFGPIGVKDECRGEGVGKALLLKSLTSMKEVGYAYAIAGWTSNAIDFYKKNANAILIEDSPPNKSVYRNMISQE